MDRTPYYYKNVFLYASLQFCGNIDEYFREHTERLLVFIVMPRVNNKYNLLRYYQNGILVDEKKIRSSSNIFLYYFLWYIQYLNALLSYFSRGEKIAVISFHPLSFFLTSVQKLFRNIEFVYWIGDYFPGVSFPLRLFERLKRAYHRRIAYTFYLSDRINKKMNGKIINSARKKTIMWGVKPKNILRKIKKNQLKILFVGLIKRSQGIENIFLFLKENREYSVKIIGICEKEYYCELQELIRKHTIAKQVYFPNVFLTDEELQKESRDCHVGIALYDTNPLNASNYADPGKIKSYAELGLPIIMSNISDITLFIKKFSCGEVVTKTNDLGKVFLNIKKNYAKYQKGLKKFNKHFYYETYYKNAFSDLEKIW